MAVSVASQAAVPLFPVDQPDPGKWHQIRAAGAEIIQGLNGRIRELEKSLAEEREKTIEAVQKYSQKLFAEKQQTEDLAKQLKEARDQIERFTERFDLQAELIRGLERKRGEDQQQLVLQQGQIHAGRQEIQALGDQVALERQQIQVVAAQLQAAVARGNALEGQIRQIPHLLEQQRKFFTKQREDEKEEQLRRQVAAIDKRAQRTPVENLIDDILSYF